MDDATARGTGLRGMLQRLQRWWHEREELGALAPGELNRLAGEFGLTARDLQDLVAQGPGGAELLKRRLNALGVSRADVERIAPGLARDLERTCGCCGEKSACQHDLTQDPDGTAWREYCPNAVSLESVRRTKGRFPA